MTQKNHPKDLLRSKIGTFSIIVILLVSIFLVYSYPSIFGRNGKTPTQKQDLASFMESQLTERYKPKNLESLEIQKSSSWWNHRWKKDGKNLSAYISYNEFDNYTNQKLITVRSSLKGNLSDNKAEEFSSSIFGYQSLQWDCTDMTLNLEAKPKEGEIPLKNVDLIAEVDGSTKGELKYYFDCKSDGQWEKIIKTNKTKYIAKDLCNYTKAENYSARVKVIRNHLIIVDTTDPSPKRVTRCWSQWVENNRKYEIVLSKLKNSNRITTSLCVRNQKSETYEKDTCFNR